MRQITVLLPKINEDGSLEKWKPMGKQDHMIAQYKSGSVKKMIHLENKLPSWSPSRDGYIMDFNDRITVASVKNFQIIDPNDSSFESKYRKYNTDGIWKIRG